MPQVFQAPDWYNDDHYITQKVDECNTIKFQNHSRWDASQVRDVLAKAYDAESYTPDLGYSNFVESGNAENCSPNPLFNVMQYVYAKAAQLNTMNNGLGYGEHGNKWTGEQVLKFFNDNDITAWDHFTKYGQFEDVNPSNAMDLGDFYTLKAEQCNTLGFDGKTDWDPQAVMDYYRENGINAVQVAISANDPNVVATSNPVEVPGGETPWVPGEIVYTDYPLVAGQTEYEGEGEAYNFIGVVGGKNATLLPATTIAGDGDDMLTATLNGDFRGFNNENALTGIDTISLLNGTKAPHSFSAQNISGVDTWNLDASTAPISLTNLAETGGRVNIKGAGTAQSTNIQFAQNATSESNDAMTIGLENVGKAATSLNPNPIYAAVNMRGIENVTIDSEGSDNFVNLASVTNASSLTITGGGNLDVSQMGGIVRTVDGSAATGDVRLNLTSVNNLTSAEFGEGSDTLVVGNVTDNATISGGKDGDDTVEIVNPNGRYQLNMEGVETLQLDGRRDVQVRLSGEDTNGLENVILKDYGGTGNHGGQFYIDNYANYDLAVTTEGNFVDQSTATVANIESVTLNVGNAASKSETFTGWLRAAQATDLTVNLNGAGTSNDTFNGVIVAPNVNTLTINGEHDGDSFAFDAARMSNNSLSNVSEIDVNGFADVDLRNAGNIGENAINLNVDASGSNGNFAGNFSTVQNNASINVAGAETGDNNIAIAGNYNYVNVHTNVGDDSLYIDFSQLSSSAVVNVDLGSGQDTVTYTRSNPSDTARAQIENAWLNALREANPNAQFNLDGTAGSTPGTVEFNNGSAGTVGSGVTASVTPSGKNYDYSNLQFAGTNNGISQTIADQGNVTLGDTGTNGASFTMGGDKMNIDMTGPDSQATITTKSGSTGAEIKMTGAVQNASLTVDLNTNENVVDKIEVSTPEQTNPGTWNTFFAKDFEMGAGKDVVFAGDGMHFIADWGRPDLIPGWFQLAGIDNYSNVQVISNPGDATLVFTWTELGTNNTWTSGLVGPADADALSATLVSVIGTGTWNTANFSDGALS